jgi:hypothetical protein
VLDAPVGDDDVVTAAVGLAAAVCLGAAVTRGARAAAACGRHEHSQRDEKLLTTK